MIKKMITRIHGRSGFTLSETLMALLILLMVTSIVAAGVPVAANAYNKVIMASNAQLLLSTTMTNLRDELGTAQDITVREIIHDDASTEIVIEYKNDKGGNSTIYQVSPGMSETREPGVHVLEVSGDNSYSHLLVSRKAATENLYLTYTIDDFSAFNGYKSTGYIKFDKLTVKTKDADKVITEIENFEIKVLTVR